MRTFDIVVDVAAEGESAADTAARLRKLDRNGSGMLVLLVNDAGRDRDGTNGHCREVTGFLRQQGVIAAVAALPETGDVVTEAGELLALERVMRDNPRLEGDRIARREIGARHAVASEKLQASLDTALNEAIWHLSTDEGKARKEPLTVLASCLADQAFHSAPILHSELLQRDRPSSSATAAVRALMYAMVAMHGEQNLGFTGYPAEMGLYMTVIKPFGLHRAVEGKFDFHAPEESGQGATLLSAWAVLEEASSRRTSVTCSRTSSSSGQRRYAFVGSTDRCRRPPI